MICVFFIIRASAYDHVATWRYTITDVRYLVSASYGAHGGRGATYAPRPSRVHLHLHTPHMRCCSTGQPCGPIPCIPHAPLHPASTRPPARPPTTTPTITIQQLLQPIMTARRVRTRNTPPLSTPQRSKLESHPLFERESDEELAADPAAGLPIATPNVTITNFYGPLLTHDVCVPLTRQPFSPRSAPSWSRTRCSSACRGQRPCG